MIFTTETLQFSADFPCSPEELYHSWLEGSGHSSMTGSPAQGEASVGASFSAWDGYIWGENLKLEPCHKIVQSWRTADFPESAAESHVEIFLEDLSPGTRLKLIHSKIPKGQAESLRQGWERYYLVPMREFFGGKT